MNFTFQISHLWSLLSKQRVATVISAYSVNPISRLYTIRLTITNQTGEPVFLISVSLDSRPLRAYQTVQSNGKVGSVCHRPGPVGLMIVGLIYVGDSRSLLCAIKLTVKLIQWLTSGWHIYLRWQKFNIQKQFSNPNIKHRTIQTFYRILYKS